MATWWLEQRASGWVVRWRDGTAKRASRSYPTKGLAQAAARQLALAPRYQHRRRPGAHLLAAPLTLRQLAEDWRRYRLGLLDDSRPGARAYLDEVVHRVVRIADRLGATGPGDVTTERLRRLREAGSTPRRALAYLGIVLRWSARHHAVSIAPRVLEELRPGPSRRAAVDLMPESDYRRALEFAEQWDVRLLVECLATYGWRPVTAARLRAEDLHDDGTITIDAKHVGIHAHPLLTVHGEQLRRLATAHAGGALFRHPETGRAWDERGDAAHSIPRWWLRRIAPHIGGRGVYDLKRRAITRMLAGDPPWPRPLTVADVRLFTAHRTDSQILRYARTSVERARDLLRGADSGADCPPGAAAADAKVITMPRKTR